MVSKNLIYQTALKYVECKIFGKQISIPYMINQKDRYCSPIGKGKAPIEEIIREFEMKVREDNLNVEKFNPNEIRELMKKMGLGIDCSGYAYHLLDAFVKMRTSKDLSLFLLRFPGFLGNIDKMLFNGKRYEKISAAILTSDINTISVDHVADIQIGDLIKMTHQGWEGKHVLIVADVTPSYILYTHSSEYVETNGVHFGKIVIRDKSEDLSKQEWLEMTLNGKNYGKDAFRVDSGDTVRRLKCLV